MKKIDFFSTKWIKRIEKMNSGNELAYRKNEITDTSNSSFDEVKKCVLHSMEYWRLAECEYLNKDYHSCINSLNLCIDQLISAFNLEGEVNTTEPIKMKLNEVKKGDGEVYIAYATNRFDDLSQYLYSSQIEEYFTQVEDENLIGMYHSIKEHNEEKLEVFLNKRIRDIRRMSVDYLIVIDFWALSLVKYAVENGMKINTKVIELGFTEQENNIFI